MSNYYTEDMSEFGYREMDMAADLLKAYSNRPPAWLGDGVKVAMNSSSGYVFLVDEDYNTAMMNGDELDAYLSTPYHGYEGFLDELLSYYNPDDLNQDDVDYILSWIDQLNYALDDETEKEWFDLVAELATLKSANTPTIPEAGSMNK